ncbi:hypothetical protein EYF80_038348 [Liparis tanakae]|uniref:Uncharacterized protein n=1 Tax=Liparis tanakae TaxID=230148 RepID=A0A4Z2GCY4_9TELE|nr:hypothetical protein EYF80_038348 [Liparis tanakae]
MSVETLREGRGLSLCLVSDHLARTIKRPLRRFVCSRVLEKKRRSLLISRDPEAQPSLFLLPPPRVISAGAASRYQSGLTISKTADSDRLRRADIGSAQTRTDTSPSAEPAGDMKRKKADSVQPLEQ